MKQILMIVLDNAVKYSRRDGIVTMAVESEAGEALVTVRNRSEHVDAGELPRVFDRFYRGRDAAADGSAGSGLGLSIARWMTEKQGGVDCAGACRGRLDRGEPAFSAVQATRSRRHGPPRGRSRTRRRKLYSRLRAPSEDACQKCCWWRTIPASPAS